MRIDLQPAYVLHTRNYRDSSMLVECLTPDYGRISGVVRGVRSTGKTAKQKRSLIQPFLPLLIGWSGNSDLKTITHFESNGVARVLTGQRLFSAMYINELLSRLLPHYDESAEIFLLYEQVLIELFDHKLIDVVLRRFELRLLECLGYGIDFTADSVTTEPIREGVLYRFDVSSGFVACFSESADNGCIFAGEDLIAIARHDYTAQVRRSAKRLCRIALNAHLGAKPLKSRELFS